MENNKLIAGRNKLYVAIIEPWRQIVSAPIEISKEMYELYRENPRPRTGFLLKLPETIDLIELTKFIGFAEHSLFESDDSIECLGVDIEHYSQVAIEKINFIKEQLTDFYEDRLDLGMQIVDANDPSKSCLEYTPLDLNFSPVEKENALEFLISGTDTTLNAYSSDIELQQIARSFGGIIGRHEIYVWNLYDYLKELRSICMSNTFSDEMRRD